MLSIRIIVVVVVVVIVVVYPISYPVAIIESLFCWLKASATSLHWH